MIRISNLENDICEERGDNLENDICDAGSAITVISDESLDI